MTTFKPEELLYVAQETLPSNGLATHEWSIKKDSEGVEYVYSIYHGEYNPEENSDQWKALMMYCLNKGVEVSVERDEDEGVEYAYCTLLGRRHYSIERSTVTQAMITAVLALQIEIDNFHFR